MTNDGRRRFSIIRMILFCLIFLFFLLLIMWLFKKNSPNMKPIYDGIFRDNINSMQDAGEAYFTNDRLPKNEGESVKISLQEMLDKNYILPFTDKDGNACDLNNSYVSVVKTKKNEYELKTYLVCGKDSNYIVKILGCHDHCENDCNKTCTIEKITQYQFVKVTEKTKNVYSCSKGTLSGKYCLIKDIDTKDKVVKTSTKTDVKAADVSKIKTPLKVTVGKEKVYVPAEKTPDTKKKVMDKVETGQASEKKVYDDPIPAPSTTEQQCVEKEEKVNYKCNCTTYTDSEGRDVTTCSTCTKTIKKEECKDVTIPGKPICPKESTDHSGSGDTLKCWHFETVPGTKKCPKESTDHSGSGDTLKCWHFETVPGTKKCPDKIKPENQSGSGESLKCWEYKDVFSCPTNTDEKSGSEESLKCYAVEEVVKCDTANGWKLKGKNCYKTTKISTKVCPNGYSETKDGKCTKTTTNKVKAKVSKKKYTTKAYKWSQLEELSGWERTGKTKTINGKEVCE